MRINLISLTSFQPSKYGFIGETPIVELPKALQERGHEVNVICLNLGEPKQEIIYGVKIFRAIPWYGGETYPSIKKNLHALFIGLSFAFNQLPDADVFHVRINPIPFLAKRFIKRKFIYDVGAMYTLQLDEFHAHKTKGYKINPPLKIERIAEIKAYRLADRIIAITNLMKERIIRDFNVEAERIDVIPDGVNVELFKPIKAKHEEPIIAYEGSIAPFRGIEELIVAFSIIKKKMKSAKLLIIGGCDRPYFNELLSIIHKLKLSTDDVMITGYVSYKDVPKHLAKAKVAVSPIPPLEAYKMSTPMKLLEYLAMELPVVATKEIQFHREVIADKCGILVKNDVNEIAKGIITLLENPDLAERMGKEGRKIVENRYTWRHIAEKFENSYLKA